MRIILFVDNFLLSRHSLSELQKYLSVYKDDNATADGTAGKPQLEDVVTSLTQANSAADRSWSFATCYPRVDVDSLISVLHDLRSILCEIACFHKASVKRKILAVRADPKAKPQALLTAEEELKQIGGE